MTFFVLLFKKTAPIGYYFEPSFTLLSVILKKLLFKKKFSKLYT